MTKEMMVKMAKAANDGIVEVVCKTTPKLNKYARTRGADGKRIPEWKVDGKVVDRKVLDDYLPIRKSEEGDEVWLKIGLDNLS